MSEQGRKNLIAKPYSDYVQVSADLEKANASIGKALELLGEYGAGGAPAGLVGGIHNMASRAEKAEDALAKAKAALREINDLRYKQQPSRQAFEQAVQIAEPRLRELDHGG